MRKFFRPLGLICLGWLIGSCGGDATGPPPPPTTDSVTISALTATVVPAASVQLSATAKDRTGRALSRVFAWSSSDISKATVSSSGVVSGVAPGTATVTAAVDGKSASSTITVLDGGVVSAAGATLDLRGGQVDLVIPADALTSSTNISVVPSTAYADDPRVVKGTAFDFGPTGTTFSKPVSLRIKYASTDLPQGTEEAALQVHLFKATGWEPVEGSVVDVQAKTVTAPISHFSVYAILTPVPVAAVTIRSPPEGSQISDGVLDLIAGDAEQLVVTLTDSQGGILSNRAISWTTSDSTIASVTTAGLVTAMKAGTTIVSATAGGVTSSVTVKVTPVPVAAVAVTLSASSIQVAQTSQAATVITDAAGHPLTDRAVAWSSDNSAIASVSSSGLVTAVAPGSATITATSEGKSGSASITVSAIPVASVKVTLSPASVTAIGTSQATATTLDANGAVLTERPILWSSSNTSVATIDAQGVVTAVAVGTTTITATSEGKTGGADLVVTDAPVATVAVSLAASSALVGQTTQASAVTSDQNGRLLSGRSITWSSSNTAVATVSAAGLVTAVGAGTADITAASEGKTGSAPFTGLAIPVAAVEVTPNTATLVLAVTPTQQLTATVKAADGAALTGRAVSWVSSDPAIATVDQNGLVTAVAAGTTTVTATSEGKSGTSSVTVSVAPVASVSVTLGLASITAVGTTQATATTLDANGNALSGRTVTWSSSNPAVATVSATGAVTAVAAGTSNIVATSEGKTGSASLTVTPAPVASVAVSSPSTPVSLGQTQQLRATTKDANGTVLTGRTITWVSSNSAVLTVSGTGSPATVTAVGLGTATITATSESVSSSPTAAITVNPVPVAAVTVSLNPGSITAVGTSQATATALDANGQTLTGRAVTWASDNTAIATVDAQGVVTALTVGTANISATSEGKTGSATLTITQAPVASLSIDPSSASVVQNGTQQLIATARDARDNIITGAVIDWSSDEPNVATVSANGLVSAIAPGVATIAGVSGSKLATATITVTPIPVASVHVTLASVSVIAGQTTQATATTLDAAGNALTDRSVQWRSDNTAVATVSTTGLVTSISAGNANIIATSETKTGSAELSVAPVPIAVVVVSPPSANVILGSTQQLVATTKDASGNALAGREVVWSSTDPAIASVDATGLVTARALGSATIKATSEGKVGASSITVVPVPVASVSVSLTPATITAVGTSQAAAVTRDASGAELSGRSVSWSSSNPGVATVSTQGVVTAVAPGFTNIIATSEGKSGSAPLTVTAAPVATVTVDPPTATVYQGETEQLTATVKDARGEVLSGRSVTWSSSNNAIASVSTTGLVTAGNTMGPVTITATSEGQSGTSSISVSQVPVDSVSVSLAASTINVGQSTQASATLRDGSGNVLTGRTIAWASDNPSIATVSVTGLVTAIATGTAHITAASGGQAGNASLTVTPVPVASVMVTLATPTMEIGQSTQATATTRDANNNVLSGRAVTWSSDNTAVATVNTNGDVTAIAAGSARIVATSEGVSGNATLTVVPVPVASLTLSAANTPVLLGQAQQLTAVPKDAGGNNLAGRTVNWVSSNPAVLSLSAASTISSTTGATVTVTAAGVGTAIVTASSESAPSVATPVITVDPIPVATVTVTPSSANLVLGVTPTQQLTATLRDASNNLLSGRAVTWTSSNPSVANVDANGFVTAVGGGTTTITATSETKTGTASINVTIPVASVTVSPSSVTLPVSATHQLVATTSDANGVPLSGRTVTWSSNSPAATVSTSGLVTAAAEGSAVITATSEGKTGTSSITITPVAVATVAVSLDPTSITAVGTSQATATTRDADGNLLTGRAVSWSSSNPSVATVDGQGSVTAVSAGSSNITATSEGKIGSAPLTVTAAPVATVTVTPTSASLVIGITPSQQLTAVTKDAKGRILSGRQVTWTSSSPTTAGVDANGLVTAAGAGTTTITATSEGQTATSSITVTLAPVSTIDVTLSASSITAVGTSQATAVTRDANGQVITDRSVSWSSSNTTVATVDNQGLVTAVAVGTSNIVATSEGKTGSAILTVTQAPVATVTISPPSATVVQGDDEQLTVSLKDAHDNPLTRSVTWSSSDNAVATVSQAGLVHGVSPGTVSITATSESQSGTSSVTVSPVPVASVAVTLAAGTITDAQTTQATAVLKDADSTVLTGRTVTWTTDNPAVASVSTSGLVTAVAPGTAQIRASSGGQTGTAALTVIPSVATVSITPSSASVIIGTTKQLVAESKDAGGNTLIGRDVTWSSSDLSIATVSSSGLVTAVALGGATITATSEGKIGTSAITVVPVPVALVTVSLGSTTVTAGQTTQATATMRDASGNVLANRTATWSSGNPAIATVSASGLVTALTAGTVQIIAMSEGKTGSATLTVNPVPVATVTVSPASATLVLGITPTQQLSAAAKDANGNVLAGRLITWSSSNEAVATVSGSGLVTAIAAGTSTITATSEGKTGTSSITVSIAPVASVNVTLGSSSITAVGTTQATATTLDANGNPLTGRAVSWSSSNTAVATVSATTGLVTAVAPGTANIIATSEGKTGSATLTVTPAPVATVTVSPASATLVLGITPTQLLSAVTKDGNGNVLSGRAVTWSSSNNAAATVSGSGLVTAVAAGTTTITATSEGKTGTSSITVTVAPVASVTVSLNPSSITAVGTSQATATTLDANGQTLTGRAVTWSSSNPSVATVSSSGLVTAVSAGTANIIATSETKAGSAALTVTSAPVATVTVTPGSASLVVGITPTQQLTAVTKDANGTVLTGRVVTWSSSNAAAATVNATGLVTAAGAGSATITATSEGQTGASSISVTLAPVASVTVSAATTPMSLGQTQQLTATMKDANGNVLTGRSVSWLSSNTAVLTVTASGSPATVTAVGLGNATITATSESVSSSPTAAITVNPVPVASVTVSLNPSSITAVGTSQATAATLDANGNPLSGRAVSWTSSNTTVATVDAQGVVAAVAAGTSSITATSEGKTGSATLTVTQAPVATVTVTLAASSINAIQTTQATATLFDAKGRTLTGRTVTWSSDNTSVASVSSSGLVSAVSAGTANIVAASEGQTGSSPLTVTPAPVATVTVSPANATLVLGITPTQQLTAATKDANGNLLTDRNVTWSSSNTGVASVSASGLVTAVSAGTSTITATSEGKTGTSSITVSIAPVASVNVTLGSSSITAVGTTQATATTLDANGNPLTGRAVTWASSNTAVATVDAQGVVSAVAVGTASISATSEGKTGNATITVTQAPVAAVTVSLTPSSITAIQTSQATATLLDAKGRTLTGRTVAWSSDNSAVATVSSTTGLVTAVSTGTANIVATSEGKTGSAQLTVSPAPVATVTVSPSSVTLVIGITPTQQLTAVTKDANGNSLSGRAVTWASSNPAAATVDVTGLVTAVGAGTATVTATSEGQSGTSSITVTVAPVATVNVALSASSVTAVETSQATATTLDANGQTLTGRAVTWSSSNTAVATVDNQGLVTAVAIGTADIVATSEGKTGSASLTVTQAPVANVAVSLTPSSINAVQTSQATGTLTDSKGRTLTGRSVTWSSSNTAVATVSSAGLVSAVAEGSANIVATSEGKTGSAPLTVTQAPVATVTVSPSSASILSGNDQQLTATLKDARNAILTGRTVTWSSDNNAVATVSPSGLVTGASEGTATVTATSEGINGTSSITVTVPTSTASLLHRVAGSRYFVNASGQAVYLTGSHTWSSLQDNGTVDPPPAFDYTGYLDFLEANHHNFFRLWAWEQSKWTAEIAADYWITPGPFLRVGPDLALDGKPKFDLTQFNQAYFDRLRSRVQAAGARGIYVSVMLFDGWSVAQKGGSADNFPWKGHPFNAANNINGIDGDTNGDGQGFEVQTLGNSAVTAYEDAYVRKVIETVGDLDNVLYEIDNEGDPSSTSWQYHMIDLIHTYEATRAKQHPVGITAMWPNGSTTDLTNSSADWVSLAGSLESPQTATGSQVWITDTDHICGVCGTTSWIWKSFVKGHNLILMDKYDGAAIGLGAADNNLSEAQWTALRSNMGYARDYALLMDLNAAVPHGDKVLTYNGGVAQTGYCLAKLGSQYVVYLPDGGNVGLDLSEVTGSLSVEWLNPVTGAKTQAGTVAGGPSVTLTAPFGGPAVLFLH